jgi:predicted membrane protein
MDKKQMKVLGIVCLIVCAICVFVAIERYNANASNVRAIEELHRTSPLGGMMGDVEMEPATPAATKYALVFAALAGIGGAILVVRSGTRDS